MTNVCFTIAKAIRRKSVGLLFIVCVVLSVSKLICKQTWFDGLIMVEGGREKCKTLIHCKYATPDFKESFFNLQGSCLLARQKLILHDSTYFLKVSSWHFCWTFVSLGASFVPI